MPRNTWKLMVHPSILWPRTLSEKVLLFLLSSFFGSLHSARLIFSSLTTSASPLSSSSPAELSNNTVLPAIILRAVFCLNASYEKRKKKKKKNGGRRWNKNVGGVYPKDDPSRISFFLNSFYYIILFVISSITVAEQNILALSHLASHFMLRWIYRDSILLFCNNVKAYKFTNTILPLQMLKASLYPIYNSLS